MHGSQREAAYQEEIEGDVQPLIAARAVRVLKSYGPAILLALTAVLLAYALIATAVYLLAPSRRITSVPFRLNFEGATTGVYPNGMKFSTAEITADPILAQVHKDNRLGDMIPLQDFTRRLYVLESNRDFEQLALEYRSKLADPKLSPVDRERMVQEFDQKRASLSKSDYSISFVEEGGAVLPRSVVRKVLSDVLTTWAKRAAVDKHALEYLVPVLSQNVIDSSALQRVGVVDGVLLLRRRVVEVITNLDRLSRLPGIQLVRTSHDQASLSEIRIALEDLLRFNLEPLITSAQTTGGIENPSQAIALVEAQLAYDQRVLSNAQAREAAVRSVLDAYEQNRNVAQVTTREGTGSAAAGDRQSQETVMPQINDTFLNRIVDLATRTADREYRQELANEIKVAALVAVPAETAVQYDRQLLDQLKLARAAPANREAANRVRAELMETSKEVSKRVGQLNEIYVIASRQLYPPTELYTPLGPPATHTERATSLYRLAMYGFFVLLLSIPFAIALAFLHARIRREEEIEVLEAATER